MFGALIGFVPTVTITLYQARQQKSQLLLDRKMSALRDFSAVVGGGGELMSAVAELDVAIYHLGHLEPRARAAADWQRVDSLYKLVIDRRYKWTSEVNTQAAMIVALFPPAASPPECRTGGMILSFSKFANAQRSPAASQEETIASMRANVEAFKKELAQTMDNTLETIRCNAAHVTD
jgi:hypothetical protein